MIAIFLVLATVFETLAQWTRTSPRTQDPGESYLRQPFFVGDEIKFQGYNGVTMLYTTADAINVTEIQYRAAEDFQTSIVGDKRFGYYAVARKDNQYLYVSYSLNLNNWAQTTGSVDYGTKFKVYKDGVLSYSCNKDNCRSSSYVYGVETELETPDSRFGDLFVVDGVPYMVFRSDIKIYRINETGTGWEPLANSTTPVIVDAGSVSHLISNKTSYFFFYFNYPSTQYLYTSSDLYQWEKKYSPTSFKMFCCTSRTCYGGSNDQLTVLYSFDGLAFTQLYIFPYSVLELTCSDSAVTGVGNYGGTFFLGKEDESGVLTVTDYNNGVPHPIDIFTLDGAIYAAQAVTDVYPPQSVVFVATTNGSLWNRSVYTDSLTWFSNDELPCAFLPAELNWTSVGKGAQCFLGTNGTHVFVSSDMIKAAIFDASIPKAKIQSIVVVKGVFIVSHVVQGPAVSTVVSNVTVNGTKFSLKKCTAVPTSSGLYSNGEQAILTNEAGNLYTLDGCDYFPSLDAWKVQPPGYGNQFVLFDKGGSDAYILSHDFKTKETKSFSSGIQALRSIKGSMNLVMSFLNNNLEVRTPQLDLLGAGIVSKNDPEKIACGQSGSLVECVTSYGEIHSLALSQ